MILEEKIAKLLTRKQKTLSIAESCTGGLLANRITNVPGSSGFFQLGLVVYSNKAKIKLLRIPKNAIVKYGAVSQKVAQSMATSVRKLVGSDFGIAITGIAGPTGATKDKPVGLVYVALCSKNKTLCYKFLFKGTRTAIKSLAATKTLQLFSEFIT